jgi:NTE family protein
MVASDLEALMLHIQPATHLSKTKRTPKPKIGLAIAGGGPLGAIYELGALRALDEAIDGLNMHQLDLYVGVSSGSILAASLANQITTAQMSRIFLSTPDAEFKFQPEQFLRPALGEYLNRARALPSVIYELIADSIKNPRHILKLEGIEGLARLVPTGIFDNHSIEKFVENVLSKPTRTNRFSELRTSLRVVAVDLETGQAVRFGEPGHDNIPISKAVQASAALPGLYPPVEIDGHFYVDGALRRTLHASVALRQGADLLIAINPLVPYDAHCDHNKKHVNGASRMMKGGLPLVLSQTFRSLIQSRMQIGMSKYKSQFPNASVLLVEPNRNDEKMFFTNVFSYSSRTKLIEHAYQTTRAELLASAEPLNHLLVPYGLSLNLDRLTNAQTFAGSLMSEQPMRSPLGQQLNDSLKALESLLDAR